MKKIETTQGNKDVAIKVSSFSKRYRGRGNYAVKDISFEVKPGEFHGFIGANGAGKTTTIKSLIGAYANFEGKVEIFGQSNKTKEAKVRMGYIPEAANFPKNLNTYEYITHMAHMAGLSFKEAKAFAKKEIKEIGLERLMYEKPVTFSSGQKKKVLLAQALVSNPDVIIMDEPAANLDPKARSEFFETLKELQKKGKAVFISSHILTELEHFVTAVTILDGGKVVYTGSKEKLLNTTGFEYKFTFDSKEDEKTFAEWVKKQKWTSRVDETTLFVKLEEKSNLDKSIAFIAKEKLHVNTIQANRKTLQQAYDEYVKKGSNDTRADWKGKEKKRGGK